MLTRRERHAILRDMSEAEAQLNTVLQIIGHATHNSPYGKGRSVRAQRAHDELELSDLE